MHIEHCKLPCYRGPNSKTSNDTQLKKCLSKQLVFQRFSSSSRVYSDTKYGLHASHQEPQQKQNSGFDKSNKGKKSN